MGRDWEAPAAGRDTCDPEGFRVVSWKRALPEKATVGLRARCFGLWQGGRSSKIADLAMEPDVARGHLSRSKPGTEFSDRS
jgi:hypothetical protein